MRKALSVALLLGLVTVLGNLVWSRWGRLGAAAATLEGRFRTEEQWIVAEIVQDVAEMALYASGGPQASDSPDFSIKDLPAAGSAPQYQVSFSLGTVGRFDGAVEVRTQIWSPDAYTDLVRGILAKLELEPAPVVGARDDEALRELLNPRARVIQTQNERVSARLAGGGMLDPVAHEEAALVVGSILLREAAGYFWDTRQLLCRMTAHLAFARVLRGQSPRGPAGRFADVILERGAGLTAEALTRLEALESAAAASADHRGWLSALKLSITDDWRTVPDPSTRTLLEQLAYFRAIRTTLSSHAAVDFYEGLQTEPTPDWGRIVLQTPFGIEAGRFSDDVELELAEAQDLWERTHGSELPASELIAALNRPAERCIANGRPTVLGWGTWAASLQRHICHRILHQDLYIRHQLGLKAEAGATLADMDRRFGGLTLYPFVQSLRWQHGDIELESLIDGLNTAVRTAASQPELLTPSVWADVRTTASYGVVRRGMPDPAPWFAPPVPAGTAYDATRRLHSLHATQGQPELLSTLRERDPWHQGLAHRAIEARLGKKATVDQVRQEFGARADYDLWVLSWMVDAAGLRSPERERLLEDKCRLLADTCYELARELVAVGRDADGARALRRAFDAAHDRVGVANSSVLLVRHYHESGDAVMATRVAEHAAGVYSASGLKTMGLLLEWRGNYSEAEEYFTRIERRYEQTAQLLGFYHRMVSAGLAEYEPKLQRLLPKTFPGGLERLDTARLPATPSGGVRVAEASELWSLNAGDVVVGVDGWRIRDWPQYAAVCQFDSRPELRLHVWRRGQYLDVLVRSLDRNLHIGMSAYP